MGVPFVGRVRNSSANSVISSARELYFLDSRLAFRSNSLAVLTSQFSEKFFDCTELFSSGDGFVDFMDSVL